MSKIDLLYPGEEVSWYRLSEETINDLSIDYLCEKVAHNGKEREWIKDIMVNLCTDDSVVSYRMDIFSYFMNSSRFRKVCERIRQFGLL